MAHLFPFIFVFIVIILRMIAAASKQGNQQPRTPASQTPQRTESDEERLRRFMEAVGLPPGSAPPPAVKPRPAAQAGPLHPVTPPNPLVTIPGQLRRVPPAMSAPRQQPPPIRAAQPAGVPAAQAAAAPATRHVAPVEPVTLKPLTPWVPETPEALLAAGKAEGAPAAKPQNIEAAGLLARLRDPSAIRNAIILREVLGLPKALQEPGMGFLGPAGLRAS